jgi:diguanylate cyclase (GGDEF)-like protein
VAGESRPLVDALDLKLRGLDATGAAATASTRQALDRFGSALRRAENPTESGRDSVAGARRALEGVESELAGLSAAIFTRVRDLRNEADLYSSRKRTARTAFAVVTISATLLLIAMTIRAMRSNSIVLDRLSQLAQEDALTGITNRRGLDEMLPVEFARARRSSQPLAFVMLDLDHFKKYNDRRGHAAGDALLRGAAQAWARQLRPTDLLARYGGEEFTLVLPACDADQAALLVDRLRVLVPDHQTFSAGIATWDADETASELMQRADQALLQAKKAGRNRTMIAGREPQTTLPLQMA